MVAGHRRLAAGLDPEQHAIVTHDGGPLLVVAGPGAGKTRVLTHAIAHRIGAGLPPERCLAVTFTRRARDELRDRLAALLGADTADRVTVATFHGLGLLILREQCKLLGLDADLKVADEKTRQEVLRSLSAGGSPAALAARIAAAKRVRVTLATAPDSPQRGDAADGGARPGGAGELDGTGEPGGTGRPAALGLTAPGSMTLSSTASPRGTTRRCASAAWSTSMTWSRSRWSCSAGTPRSRRPTGRGGRTCSSMSTRTWTSSST